MVGVRGGAKEAVEKSGITKLLVSISHCHTHASAFAISLGEHSGGETDSRE